MIRDSQAEKEQTKVARQQLETFTEKVKPEPKPVKRRHDEEKALEVGDKVTLLGQDSAGELISIKGKNAEVRFGDLKTYVKLDNLERATRSSLKEKKERVEPVGYATGLNLTQRLADFAQQIDVRGDRADDALTKVMSFVDDAVMLGIPEVKIVHGRGNGILKHTIRDYLRSLREIASVSDEQIERGGDGATVVVLK
jgi:DNA mismatch repair protein MutS2